MYVYVVCVVFRSRLNINGEYTIKFDLVDVAKCLRGTFHEQSNGHRNLVLDDDVVEVL